MKHYRKYNRRIFALLLTVIVVFSNIPIYGSGIQNGEQHFSDGGEAAAEIALENESFAAVSSQSEYTGEGISSGDASIVEIVPSEITEEENVSVEINTENQKETAPVSGISAVEILPQTVKATQSVPVKRELMSFETMVDDVKITVKAKEGVIPEDAELFAETVEDDEIRENIEEAVKEKRSKNVLISESFLYDISLLLDGEEFQPEGKVTVTFHIPGERSEEQKPFVYHVLSDKETEEITGAELLPIKNTESIEYDTEDEMTEISAETESFSYYVLEFASEDKIATGSEAEKIATSSEAEEPCAEAATKSEAAEPLPGPFAVMALSAPAPAPAEKPEKLTVKIEWDDNDNAWGLRPSQFSLYAAGKSADTSTVTGSITVAGSADWETKTTYSLFDAYGGDIAYDLSYVNLSTTSARQVWPQYAVKETEFDSTSGTLTVTLEAQETIDLQVPIQWDDDDDALGMRPKYTDPQTVHLKNTGTPSLDQPADSLTKEADGSYTAVFSGVPTYEIDSQGKAVRCSYNGYTITQSGLPAAYSSEKTTTKITTEDGDRLSKNRIAYTNRLRTKTVTLNYNMRSCMGTTSTAGVNTAESWASAETAGVTLPESITVTLREDGLPVSREGVEASYTFARNANGTYPDIKQVWTLPLYDLNGDPITYGTLTVDYPVLMDADDPSFDTKGISREFLQKATVKDTTFTVTNTLPAINRLYSYSAWEDDSNASGARPSTITVAPFIKGTDERVAPAKTVKNTSYVTWSDLPQLDKNGKYIEYEVRVLELPAYYSLTGSAADLVFATEKGYSGSSSAKNVITSLKFTNTYTLKKTQTAKAVIKWEGNVGTQAELGQRPASVSLNLFCSKDNGTTWQPFFGKSVFAMENTGSVNEWTYDFPALPAVDADGTPVIYKVEPTGIPSMYTVTADAPVYTRDPATDKVTDSAFVIHSAYTDNWNYKVSLEWNVSDPAKLYDQFIDAVSPSMMSYSSMLTPQYKLSVSVQKAYGIGELKVKIPLELFHSRKEGVKGIRPSEISLGAEGSESPAYSFTYRIENNGTSDPADDYILFYNYKPLSASDNIAITVSYRFSPNDVPDCVKSSLTAEAEAQYDGQASPEELSSNTITYMVDTGVKFDEEPVKSSSSLVYKWPSGHFGSTEPDWFDTENYNYVEWKVITKDVGNQPHTIKFTDTPGDEGKVVTGTVYRGQKNVSGSYYQGNVISPVTDNGDGSWSWELDAITYTSSNGVPTAYYSGMGYYAINYILTQYPRVEDADGKCTAEYTNSIKVTVDGLDAPAEEPDGGDHVEKTSAASVQWKDKDPWHWTGNIHTFSKSLGSYPTASLTMLEKGYDPQPYSSSISTTVNGYELKNGFSFDLTDDTLAAYANVKGTNTRAYRLCENDFELTGTPTVTLSCKNLNMETGAELPGTVPADPFIFWGKKSLAGDWEKIADITMTQAASKQYKPAGDLTGEGYIGFKLTSPEGLKGSFTASVTFYVTPKADSELFSGWAHDPECTTVTITNHGVGSVYKADSSGKYVKFSTLSKDYSQSLDRAVKSGASGKYTGSIKYDVSQEMLYVPFSVYGQEYYNTTGLPQEIYDADSHDTAVIYDLLPEGLVLDRGSEIFVYGPAAVSGSGSGSAYPYGVSFYSTSASPNEALLEEVETISNYHGTGRQMVIFHVKSAKEPGKSWQSYNLKNYTGFGVQFTAKGTYDEVPSGVQQSNIFAYQHDDGKLLTGGYSERGYGSTSTESVYGPEGSRYLYDFDQDGVIDEGNTYYGYVTFKPSYTRTIENSMRKYVKGASGIYGSSDAVDLGKDYSYRLNLTVDKGGETKGVVLYDILENAANTDGAVGEQEGWKGTLRSVDVRAAKSLGIDVKVYYCTDAAIDYNDVDTSTGQWEYLLEEGGKSGVWSLTAPADLSLVTAVAFDLRKDSAGNDFIFKEETANQVFVDMHFTAPDEIPESEFAYNRPAYDSSQRAKGMANFGRSFNIAKRTVLELQDLQDISFVKGYDGDDGSFKPMSGVTFKLYQCRKPGTEHAGFPGESGSCFGENPLLVSKSTSDGTVLFTDLPTGTYAVIETAIPDTTRFKMLSDRYWVFTVDAHNGTVSEPEAFARSGSSVSPVDMVKRTDGAGEVYYTLSNPRTGRSIKVQKRWYDVTGYTNVPDTLSFDLYRKGTDDADWVYVTTSTVNTKQTSYENLTPFTDIPIYDDHGNYFNYKVCERGPEHFMERNGGSAETTLSSSSPFVNFTNYHLGVLEITKSVSNDTSCTEEFTFRVTLSSKASSGTPVEGTFPAVRYDAAGAVTGSEEVTFTANAAGTAGTATVKMKAGEKIRISDIRPYNAYYTVAEINKGSYTVKTSGSTSASLSYKSTASVVFTNTVTNGTLAIPVEKVLKGAVPATAETYKFNLSAITTGAPLPSSSARTVTVTGAGTGSFGTITYSAPGTWQYKVAETKGNKKDCTYDTAARTVTVTVKNINGKWTPSYTVEDGTVNDAGALVFTNSYPMGNLKVTKTVSGNDCDKEKKFSFTVELGSPENGTFGDMVFKDGKAEFTLSDGESVTAKDLPAGITYTVTEEDYSSDGYVTTVNSAKEHKASGTIEKNETAEAAFMNTRDTVGDLTVSKTVSGECADKTKAFSFKVMLTGVQDITGKFGDMTFDGGVSEFTLKDGESIKASGIPTGTLYTVTEEDYTSEGYVTTREGDTGKISAATPSEAGFTNTKNTNGDLTVSKTVTGEGADKTKEFSFKVTLSDTSVTGTYGEMTFADGIAEFTLKDNESRTASGLPFGVEYKVTESDYSEENYRAEMSGDEGIINSTKPSVAAFTNEYKDDGKAVLIIQKEIDKLDASEVIPDTAFPMSVEIGGAKYEGKYYIYNDTVSNEDIRKDVKLSVSMLGRTEETAAGGTVYVKADQKAALADVRKDDSYSVTETPQEYGYIVGKIENGSETAETGKSLGNTEISIENGFATKGTAKGLIQMNDLVVIHNRLPVNELQIDNITPQSRYSDSSKGGKVLIFDPETGTVLRESSLSSAPYLRSGVRVEWQPDDKLRFDYDTYLEVTWWNYGEDLNGPGHTVTVKNYTKKENGKSVPYTGRAADWSGSQTESSEEAVSLRTASIAETTAVTGSNIAQTSDTSEARTNSTSTTQTAGSSTAQTTGESATQTTGESATQTTGESATQTTGESTAQTVSGSETQTNSGSEAAAARKAWGELASYFPYMEVSRGSTVLSLAPDAAYMPRRTLVKVLFKRESGKRDNGGGGGGGGTVTPYPKGTTAAATSAQAADPSGSEDGEGLDPFRLGLLNATGDRAPIGLLAAALVILLSAFAAVDHSDRKKTQ